MKENYWAEQQRRLGHGFIHLNEQRDENYWTQRSGQEFIRLKEHRGENYWTQPSGHGFIRLRERRDENYWTQPVPALVKQAHHASHDFR